MNTVNNLIKISCFVSTAIYEENLHILCKQLIIILNILKIGQNMVFTMPYMFSLNI